MTIRAWNVVGAASLFAFLAAGCASMGQRSRSSNPTTQAVQASQKQSQEALNRANEAQKKASDAAQRVADAQADVQKAQQQLTQAQARLRDEQARAEQLQREAAIATQQASREAAVSQQLAMQGLQQQGKQISQGQQVIEGRVTAASGNELSVRPEGGHSMTFQTNDRTQITLNGQPATLQDIHEGQDARVSYELSGTTPTALSVIVPAAPVQLPGGTPSGPAAPSQPSGPSAPSTAPSGPPQGSTPGAPQESGTSGSSQPPPGGRY